MTLTGNKTFPTVPNTLSHQSSILWSTDYRQKDLGLLFLQFKFCLNQYSNA